MCSAANRAAEGFSQWQDKWSDGDPTLGFFKYDVSVDKMEKSFIPLAKMSTKKG